MEAVDISQVSVGRVFPKGGQRDSPRRTKTRDSLFLVDHLGPRIEQVAQPNDRIDPASALASAQPTDGPPALSRIQVGHFDPEPLEEEVPTRVGPHVEQLRVGDDEDVERDPFGSVRLGGEFPSVVGGPAAR